MSTPSILYPESFQKLLSSAQESGIKTLTLSAIVELQRLFATGRIDADETMYLITEGARRVANATGVAIGLLEGNQLVYRAGSGNADAGVGQQVMATLVVSAHDEASGDILRAENTQSDARAEAAICRQLGVISLLVLPIYKAHTLAGVLQIHFAEAHVFQDREVRTYQLMSGLVGETMSRDAQARQRDAMATGERTTRSYPLQIPLRTWKADDHCGSMRVVNGGAICQSRIASIAQSQLLATLRRLAGARSVRTQRARRVMLYAYQWRRGLALATLLLITSWLVYRDRAPATAFGASEPDRPTAIEQQASFVSAKQSPETSPVNSQGAPVLMFRAGKSKAEGYWVRVGNNELDHVAQDVTVRYFAPNLPQQKWPASDRQVVNIGDDVTVRHLAPKHPLVSR